MKKALLTALLALIIMPLFAGGAYAETLSEKAAGATGATAAEQALPESVRGISGRIEADGQYDAPGALERLWRKMLDTAAQEIKGNLQSASALAAIALCTALASSLSPGGTAQGYISIAGVGAAAVLDVKAGYYQCPSCHAVFVPTMAQYVKGLHTLTRRRLTCPNCGKTAMCRHRVVR